jgi:hypothetical protein
MVKGPFGPQLDPSRTLPWLRDPLSNGRKAGVSDIGG